jgi:hypothetical protein
VPDRTPPGPNLNTYWVVPHKFLAGEYPGDKDPVKAREKINRFLEVGVRHFVDLTEFGGQVRSLRSNSVTGIPGSEHYGDLPTIPGQRYQRAEGC